MKFALAGNPNSGKTTLFNALTGSTAHVGNWPGVTVDKRTGTYKKLDEKVEIVDLPGIYSLSPYTPEEIVSRNFILDEKPDCVINIVDVTNLERNLYLTTQLLETDTPVVIALNMTDALSKTGGRVDSARLEKELGVPVTEISALKGTNLSELMDKAYKAAKTDRKGSSVIKNGILSSVYDKVYKLYEQKGIADAAFHAVKLIEKDELETKKYPDLAEEAGVLTSEVDTGLFEGDFEGVVADLRYKYIEHKFSGLVKKAEQERALSKSDRIDRILTHKVWGIPIFLAIMLAVFHLTFSENFLLLGLFIKEGTFDIPILGTDALNSPGVILFNAMDWLTATIGDAVSGAMPEGTWYTGLICDGLLSGVFSVLSFIPQILVLFLFLSILEDSGYMARVAFILDRAFRKFGLSGKAFMPLIMCFGCAVPGIMATRTLENEAERKRTVMLAPFFSCGAKLPIWAAFGGVFALAYTNLNATLIVYSMYILGIAVAVLASLLLKKTVVKGETPPFIMELPEYRMPQFKNTMIYLWQKLKHYIFRAATIITGAVIVIWFLTSFNFRLQMVDAEFSIIGIISKWFTWLFVPLGFGMGDKGWMFVVAAFTGLIAKEMVVGTLGVFAGISEDEALEGSADYLFASSLGAVMLAIGGTLGDIDVSVPAMFSFMAFNLLSVPCMAAVAAANGELGGKKNTLTAIAFWMITAYAVSLAVFWYGVFFKVSVVAASVVLALIVAALITLAVLKYKGVIGAKSAVKQSIKGE